MKINKEMIRSKREIEKREILVNLYLTTDQHQIIVSLDVNISSPPGGTKVKKAEVGRVTEPVRSYDIADIYIFCDLK